MTQIELLLEQETHIIKLEPAERWVFPEINYSQFLPNYLHLARNGIADLQQLLASPYVFDDFQNHSERRDWRLQMSAKYGVEAYEFLKSNSLRHNLLSAIISHVHVLKRVYCGPEQTRFNQVTDDATRGVQTLRHYDDLSPEEKVTFAKELKKKAYEVLRCLAK